MRAPSSHQVASFGPFELDLKAGELRRDGHALILQEQPFLVLKMLLEQSGNVVTREEMRRTLWPNNTVVEFDQSINAAIKKLRVALQDSADEPQFVETVARRGYRLIVPVQWSEPSRDGSQAVQSARPVTPPSDNNILIGKKVSHYRVLEILGGGGMGVVYKAEDIKLGRRVALKFLPEELANDPAAMQRFEREARAASTLNHPNICTIHAVEEHEGQPFIVMELLEGHTLYYTLSAEADSKSNSFRLELLLDTALQIARGLEAAHQKGIVHRDIKPANIFITNRGQAKILDFGLAKLHESESAEPQPQLTAGPEPKQELNPLLTLTRTGVTVGTAAYMSPEQVRGEKLDQRTDLFSFGLVLYEMTTRQRAFPGDTAAVLHDAILNRVPLPARELNAQIPPKLENVIRKAIEKDRDARYQTAAEICSDLEALGRDSTPKHLPRGWIIAVGVAAAIALATLLFTLNRPPNTVAVLPEIKLRQLTFNSGEYPVIDGAISPDGKYLAYSDHGGLHLKVIDTGETHTAAQPEELKTRNIRWRVVGWFPDNTRFLVNEHLAAEGGSSDAASVWVVSVLGGAPVKLRDHAVGCAVSPDGAMVSFATNHSKYGEREVWFMEADGDQARKYYEAPEGSGTDCGGWSPDGKHYFYVLRDQLGLSGMIQPVEGGPPVRFLGNSELSKMNDFVWLHDGRTMYDLPESDTVCNYWIMRFDPYTGNHLEKPRRLTNWPSFCVASGSVTKDDKRFAFVGWSGFYTSYIADLEAGGTRLRNVRRFTLEESNDGVRGWTTGGKVIVARNKAASWNIYLQALDSDTHEATVSSGSEGVLLLGATTPDRKWYIGRIWPNGESVDHPTIPLPVLRIPLAGGVPETLLRHSRETNVSCSRPPSNTCVIAEQSQDRKQMIVSILNPMKGRGPELARFNFERELDVLDVPICVISPDGSHLAVARSPESPLEIYSLRGKLLHKIRFPSEGKLIWLEWSVDQKGFFISRRGQRGSELVYLDFEGRLASLRNCAGRDTCHGLPSPDGRHLAIIDRDQSNNMWLMENF